MNDPRPQGRCYIYSAVGASRIDHHYLMSDGFARVDGRPDTIRFIERYDCEGQDGLRTWEKSFIHGEA
jgi:hypothetical protein